MVIAGSVAIYREKRKPDGSDMCVLLSVLIIVWALSFKQAGGSISYCGSIKAHLVLDIKGDKNSM